MKIRTKILFLFTLGAIVPLLLSHFFATRMVTASIRARIAENLSHSVELAAGRIGDHVERSIKELSLVVDAVPFESFPANDLHRALEIPYRQLPGATAIAILDETGKAMAPPYYKAAKEAEALGRDTVQEMDLKTFGKNVPLKLALAAEVALGPVYHSSSGTPRMVLAKAFPLADGQAKWVLAVELSLGDICKLVTAHGRPETRHARVIDVRGRVVCGSFENSFSALKPYAQVEQLEKMTSAQPITYIGDQGESVLGVIHEVEIIGWVLLLEQPESLAMEPVRRSLYWTALWIVVALGIAFGGGVILSKELTKPISELEEAATRIAKGDYERTLDIRSGDEVGRLAGAFNHMTAEVRAWNAELTERVEERTRALREAREQIIQTQKLAAVGELGSGVAHEINNPLAGVIGMAQLIQSEVDPSSEVGQGLATIISDARRVAEVVEVLLRFSQKQVAPEMQAMDVSQVVDSALGMFSARISERKIAVEKNIIKDCRIFGRENELRLALINVLDNAMQVMPGDGRLRVGVKLVEGGAVRISIMDNGPGMPEEVRSRAFDPFFTTNNPGSGSRGLGLPLVHQVVTEHDGRVVLDSSSGQGTEVCIYLPGAARLSRD
ncbi:MAG: HAMP domain-containing histidine kinase [Deltaproteobacteria bacterium]|nr:HAMP domain-containing histidine kinase [Deltaproteobacteria bacterium]